MPRGLVLLPLPVLLCASLVAAQANLVRNPGFESGATELADWTCPPYWSGSLAPVTAAAQVHSGQRAALLTAAVKEGRAWGRVHTAQVAVDYGLRYRYSVWARGTGTLKLGAINYSQRGDKTEYAYQWQQQPTALTGDWQELALAVEPLEAGVQRIALTIEVEGEGAAVALDDVSFVVSRTAAGELRAPAYYMVPVGSALQVPVTVSREGQPWTGGAVTALLSGGAAPLSAELPAGARGEATYAFPGSATPALLRLSFLQADLGAAATCYLDVVDQATYEAFAAAARAARLGALPCHLLFLGDSLTDFLRGQNYTDQVAFWLSQVHPGQVTYRNAGVGGDYISRTWQRLSGDPKVYRPEAFRDLYAPKPQRIFIMLGHNDSKLSSRSSFTEPQVPAEQFSAEYAQVLGKLKQETGAAITVLSATSSVYEITKATADKTVAAGRACNLFGKPEALEQFNALAKAAAGQCGCDYLDVYEPTRRFPDKPSLFAPDGVHLTLAGNHLLALEILKHLGR